MDDHHATLESQHPVNVEMYDDAPLSVRIADAVNGFMGSWRFIGLQTVIVAAWLAGNVAGVFHFDPYPFILLNLAFSTQAAYTAPLILLASDRAAQRDRLTLEHAAREAEAAERQEADIIARLDRIERLVSGVDASPD
jgi:uncharacterized membrane protein